MGLFLHQQLHESVHKMGHNPNVESEKDWERRERGVRETDCSCVSVPDSGFHYNLWEKSDQNTSSSEMPLTEDKPVGEMKESPSDTNTRLLSLLYSSHQWISLDCHTVSRWCHWWRSRRTHAQIRKKKQTYRNLQKCKSLHLKTQIKSLSHGKLANKSYLGGRD